jgi:hypothetical protein
MRFAKQSAVGASSLFATNTEVVQNPYWKKKAAR